MEQSSEPKVSVKLIYVPTVSVCLYQTNDADLRAHPHSSEGACDNWKRVYSSGPESSSGRQIKFGIKNRRKAMTISECLT